MPAEQRALTFETIREPRLWGQSGLGTNDVHWGITAVGNVFYDRVEAGDVAATNENADALFSPWPSLNRTFANSSVNAESSSHRVGTQGGGTIRGSQQSALGWNFEI
jgi:hypothetical protein